MQSLRLLLCAFMTVAACAPQELLAASGPGVSPNVELNTAAETGNLSELKAALRAGASVNTPVVTHWGPNPELPLNTAVSFRHIDAVRLLLKAGADPNSAIDSASCVAPDIIKELLEHGANPNSSYGTRSSPLTGTVIRGSTSLAKECLQSAAILIAHGAKINGTGNGDAPLSNAVENNAVPFIKLFLSKGANVNILDGADLTPLMEALRNYANQIACSRELKKACPGPGSYLPTMELLLNHGADPNFQAPGPWRSDFANYYPDLAGSTGLCIAARYGWYSVARVLLEHGADPSIPRSDGTPCIALAKANGHRKLAALIARVAAKRGRKK